MKAHKSDVAKLSAITQRMLQVANRNLSLRYDSVRFGILQLSYDRKRIRPNEIATALNVNPSSVTRRVQELKDEGLIRVVNDPHDGRSLFVEITARGKTQMQRYLKAGIRDLAAAVDDWNASDVRTFTNLLTRLVETWEQRETHER